MVLISMNVLSLTSEVWMRDLLCQLLLSFHFNNPFFMLLGIWLCNVDIIFLSFLYAPGGQEL